MGARRLIVAWLVVVGAAAFAVVGSRTQGSGLAHFDSSWFGFEYPAAWSVIADHESCPLHGPDVFAAVGTGDLDVEGTVMGTVETCPSEPGWVVPSDGVVVAYRADPRCCPIPPQPRRPLTVGQELVQVDGVEAVRSETAHAAVWHLFSDGPEYIEARWGAEVDAATRAAVFALVASWEWRTPED